MVSAERVMGYCRLEPEASLETHPDSAKPSDWPDKGHIELKDVTYRHYPDGPLVLKGVSATILPSEKVILLANHSSLMIMHIQIGIVGRTGAGKSSLIATLFRLAEPNGSIKIDGEECFNLGLHDVRSKISIIPQVTISHFTASQHQFQQFCYLHQCFIYRMAMTSAQFFGRFLSRYL